MDKPTVQDIFNRFYPGYLERHTYAASGTLDELCADPKYLGAKIGYLCILHTWGSEMNFHPHIHAIVLGGGLDAQNHWKGKRDGFFLPIHVLSRKFRGKYMAELKRLWQDGRLVFGGTSEKYRNHYTFHELMDACYKKEWIPIAKKHSTGHSRSSPTLGNTPTESQSATTGSYVWMKKRSPFLSRIIKMAEAGKHLRFSGWSLSAGS